MKTLTCDVCKQKIQEPVSARSYFHFAHRDICESCKETLEMRLRPIIRTKGPFSYDWYDKLVKDSVEKAIEKGKF